MNEYLKQIQGALDNKLYLIALQCCLTIPDICGALQSDNGEANSNKYKTWYNNFFKKKHRIKTRSKRLLFI